MQVDNISSVKFEAKKRFVTQKMRNNIECLLTRMNSEVKESGNENYFKAIITKSLKYGDKAEFIDGRIFIGRIPRDKQMQKETLFTMGKTQLVIDNKTGEIIDYKKPFFTRWSKIMKNLDKFLDFFCANYNNEKFVKKKRLSMEGFTEKGWEKMCKLKGLAK